MQQGVVAVVRHRRRILVVRRGAAVPFPGYWAPVSGKVEPGERPEQAVVREVQEEVGLAVRPLARVWESASSDGLHWLDWWLVEPVSDEISLRLNAREVDAARWLYPAEFRDLERVFAPDLRFFEEILPALGR